MASRSLFFVSLAFVLLFASADGESCKSLEPKILECSSSGSRGSARKECCRLAEQYVRRLGCTRQAEVGREIIRSCEEQEQSQDELPWSSSNLVGDSRECMEMEPKLRQCTRSRGSTPKECCRLADQYVRRLQCTRSADAGRQIIRSCQEQEEDEQRQERQEHEILSFIFGDSKECRRLEPRLRECSRSTGSTPPECCKLAEDYVRELRCSRRADAGREIIRSCQQQEQQQEDEIEDDNDGQECMALEPKLRTCTRSRGQVSRKCCDLAEEYVHELGCTRRADASRQIIRSCQEQQEQQEEEPCLNMSGEDSRECKSLEGQLLKCGSPASHRCCKLAKEYVHEHGCTPRSDAARKMIESCEQQSDYLKIRKYGYSATF